MFPKKKKDKKKKSKGGKLLIKFLLLICQGFWGKNFYHLKYHIGKIVLPKFI